MRSIPVELDEWTIESLEIERELLAFDDRSAYVRWIVDNRASIEPDSEVADLVGAYRERIQDLEGTIETLEARIDELEDELAGRSADADGATGRTADADGATQAGEPTLVQAGSEESALSVRSRSVDGVEAGAATDGADGSIVQPPRLVRGDSASTDDGEIQAANLRPEHVVRIREDRVAEDAGVLGSVTVDRVDELSRRAVAKTRKQLDRPVETGLEYTSSSRLATTDVRHGEDVVSLEDLSVPGRSDDLVERRRELVGRAIAFLRDEGRARRSDFVDALYEEVPAGYETVDAWWRCVKEGLKQVEAVDGGSGSRVWRYGGGAGSRSGDGG